MTEGSDKKLTCLVVEDELPAQRLLSHFIGLHGKLELKACVADVQEAIEMIERQAIDLLFLDVQLPGMDGFGLLDRLGRQPMVVFITGHHEYASRSFNYNVVDFLVKPIRQEHFDRAVGRALEKASRLRKEDQPQRHELPEHITLKVSGKLCQVRIAQIRYLQSCGNYVKVYTDEGMMMTSSTTRALLGQFLHRQFIRIHRSYIVNCDFVTSWDQTAMMLGEAKLPIGISYRQSVSDLLHGKP